MDAHDANNGNGNGHAGNGGSLPPKESLPSTAPSSKEGAPVEPPSSKEQDVSAGAPPVIAEPLIVVDNDPPVAPTGPARRAKLTPNQVAFLSALAAEAGNVSAAARRCEQSRSNHDRWLGETDDQGNPTPKALAYRELVQAIDIESCDEVEEEIRRRGIKGVKEPVFYQGEICGYVRKFSDLLLIFRAKALMPEKYRERHEVTGAGGKPLHPAHVTVDVNLNYSEALKTLSEDELEQHNAIAQKLLARSGSTTPPGAN